MDPKRLSEEELDEMISEATVDSGYNVSDLVKEKVDFEMLVLTAPPSFC